MTFLVGEYYSRFCCGEIGKVLVWDVSIIEEFIIIMFQGIWSLFLPAYQQVKKELSDKTMGDIRLLRAEICWPFLNAIERFKTPALGGGGLYSLGIYPIILACVVFGDMPESVTAVGHLTPEGT